MKHTKFYEEQFDLLKQQLGILAGKRDAGSRLKEQFQQVRRALSALRSHIQRFPFESEQEEIYFFKYVKPRFYAAWLFVFEKHRMEISLPKGTQEMRKRFLQEEFDLLQRYFQQNQFYYHYYRSEATELDTLCFLRDSGVRMITVPEISELEQSFSTACDLLFARFMAYEQLQEYILSLMDPAQTAAPVASKKRKPTRLNLSVDQLGLLTRAADDARLVLGHSFSRICADLAPYLASREKERLSAASLRSNAYVGEEHDKKEAIRMLEKMIQFIKGY